ncbi:hypothetical protein DSO57_1022097 [Entomophthora muscae]|uniref:Uncharacterized protein n=1 Tax=Entomophthora muscae TaxID=34485 RepID=A0ACC2T3A7_9FUNG|nr:hypothetical protein DSO57_1022097 [Entomophthora muscae]
MNPILRLGFPVVCLCRASENNKQLLLDAFQSQLNRMDSKIMAVNLQAMSINPKSHHSPLRSSSPEFYHSYKSNDDHTWLAPNAVKVLELVLESEDDVLATPEASGAAQDREGERKAQQEENCCHTSEARFAASTLSCSCLTRSPVRITPAPLQQLQARQSTQV